MWRDRPHVYFLRPVGVPGPVKIGWSVLPTERLRAYQSWSPIPLELVARTPGAEPLEARFHSHFAHLHSHGEWFHAAPELDAMILAINGGTFDAATLPEVGRRMHRKVMSPESIEASRMTRRLSQLGVLGIDIPPEVKEAGYTYGFGPEEVARRRAVVREFVLAQRHLWSDAAAAYTERSRQWRAQRKAA